MKDANNDNDPLTFSKLGLAAALIVNRLRNEIEIRDVADEPERGSGGTEDEKAATKKRYVDQRLKEIRAFEDRASGRRRNRN